MPGGVPWQASVNAVGAVRICLTLRGISVPDAASGSVPPRPANPKKICENFSENFCEHFPAGGAGPSPEGPGQTDYKIEVG